VILLYVVGLAVLAFAVVMIVSTVRRDTRDAPDWDTWVKNWNERAAAAAATEDVIGAGGAAELAAQIERDAEAARTEAREAKDRRRAALAESVATADDGGYARLAVILGCLGGGLLLNVVFALASSGRVW
jgi:hypothetical protein